MNRSLSGTEETLQQSGPDLSGRRFARCCIVLSKMIFLASIIVLLIAHALWQWRFGPSEYAPSGGRTFPITSIAIHVLLLALLLWAQVRHHGLEKRLTGVATELTGEPAPVSCETFLESWMPTNIWALGYVSPDLKHISLRHGVCRRLQEVIDSPDPNSRFHSTAVVALTHEAMHVRGLTNEAQTECAAIQRAGKAAMLLGVPDRVARELARAYWSVQYQQIRQTTDDSYYSVECRPNGALDEGLPDPPWKLESSRE